MEKLLYWTWRGESRAQSRESLRGTEERIEERRKTRIGVSADITITHPNADDFDSWMRGDAREDASEDT